MKTRKKIKASIDLFNISKNLKQDEIIHSDPEDTNNNNKTQNSSSNSTKAIDERQAIKLRKEIETERDPSNVKLEADFLSEMNLRF